MKNGILLAGKILAFVLILVFLELNRHTVTGWILEILLFAGYLYLAYKVFAGHKFLAGCGLFLGFLALTACVIYLSWPPVRHVPAVAVKNPAKTEIRETNYGPVRGVFNEDKSVEVYAGIPYAKPPVGDLRWKEPVSLDPWTDVLEADHFAPMSAQPVDLPAYSTLARLIGYHEFSISLHDNWRPPVSEDSLYLNIWRPAGNRENLPVIVYVHGGSLQTGQPWYEDYSGEGLAKKGAIVINMGYRLGAFGFYADEDLAKESPNGTTGNYGTLDVIQSLVWVKENIQAFGGDPDNITVAGESAGSALVSALCTSPLAKGLFQRAVMESSTVASINPPHSFRLLENALASGKEMKKRHKAETLEDLRKLPMKDLVDEAYTQHHITVDGYVLTETPYESYRKGIHNETAIFHGYNSDEAGPFVLFGKANLKNYEKKIGAYFGEYAKDVLAIYPAKTDEEAERYWREIYGAVFFSYPHYCLNRLAAQNNIPVYEYYFSKENGRLGPWHSGEEVYLYNNIPADSGLYNEKDRELADVMSDFFLSFAKTGVPSAKNAAVWTTDVSSETLMEFGDEIKTVPERSLELYQIMDRMEGWNN